MKKLVIIIFIIGLPFGGYAQDESLPKLEAYFSAIMVHNLDTSINWYANVLAFAVLDKTESKERGFRQANLKMGSTLLELIELNSAVSLEDVAPNYNSKTRITGFFKIGFLATDFDNWINHLEQEKVDFHGVIVTDNLSGKRMVIIKDPDGNRIQIFEN
jgi:catechol 2,3-dioxygenase-like lactoylglutathione lyase family enzyme